MKKLNCPPYAATDLYDASVKDLNNVVLQEKFLLNRNNIIQAFTDFDAKTLTKTWCDLPKARHGNPKEIIVGNLSKADLVMLYDDGVVKSNGQARNIYDKIKLLAHDECPYCGGIGDIGFDGELGTADHFLPKSRFPSYSVLPLNLVPACQVCNKGKGSNFPTNPSFQPLHPYLDKDRFFKEKWTVATLRDEDPIVVDFDAAPPASWSLNDQKRVIQHFRDCKLASRYRSRVSQELMPLISQRKSVLKILTPSDFKEFLMVVAQEPNLPINGWKRTLYYALSETVWFCERKF